MVNCWLSGAGLDDAVDEVGLNKMADFRFQRLLRSSGARREIDDTMGWVVGLLSACEILRREKLEMVADRESFRLCVEMVDIGGGVAASDEPEGAILDEL